LKSYRKEGAPDLISKHRDCKTNNRLSKSVKKQGLNLLKTKYQGFGPTLVYEKLVEKDKLSIFGLISPVRAIVMRLPNLDELRRN